MEDATHAENWREAGFGVYVHWPFCEAKCPYCDFNSHVSRTVDHAAWRAALVKEVRLWSDRLPGRTVGSVFFGGGTPSLMEPETVGAVLDAIAACWSVAPDAEVTLEANPTSTERGRFAGFATAGVGRVSLGVQALDDGALRRLGRTHDARQALAALDTARAAFGRVSFDLIYARQDQSLAAWEAELRRAIALGVDHLSLYQLTIEPGTAFGRLSDAGRLGGLPGEGLGADLYDATQAICEVAGMPAYEVSNHARPGAASRHNLAYWRGGDWVGIGPGAFGRWCEGATRWESRGRPDPAGWLGGVDRTVASPEPGDAHGDEYLMMGLRLREGVALDRLERLRGAPPDAGALAGLRDDGLIAIDRGRLRATPRGRPVLNEVIRRLL